MHLPSTRRIAEVLRDQIHQLLVLLVVIPLRLPIVRQVVVDRATEADVVSRLQVAQDQSRATQVHHLVVREHEHAGRHRAVDLLVESLVVVRAKSPNFLVNRVIFIDQTPQILHVVCNEPDKAHLARRPEVVLDIARPDVTTPVHLDASRRTQLDDLQGFHGTTEISLEPNGVDLLVLYTTKCTQCEHNR